MSLSTMTLYEFMLEREDAHLASPWFVDAQSGRAITGADIKARTDALTRGLQAVLGLGTHTSAVHAHEACGIRDVAAIVSPNAVDFGTVVWAAHRLGCTVASCTGGSTVDELVHQFTLSDARTVFVHSDALDRVLEAAAKCGITPGHIVAFSDQSDWSLPDQYQEAGIHTLDGLVQCGLGLLSRPFDVVSSPVAFLCFSSGTTGLPKAVIVPHSSIIANVSQVKNSAVPTACSSPGDRSLGVIPFSHMFGLVTLVHLCPYIGVATVAFKSMPSFPVFLETVVRLRIAHLFLVPPLVSAFVKHPATANVDLRFFKSAMIAAAPLDAEMESAFQRVGGPGFIVTQGFGMTECGGLITALPLGADPLPGSVGRVLDATEIKITDARGNEMPAGERGLLSVRGPQLCPGYLNNPAANSESFDADGFLLTGDIAYRDPDGYIFVVDRKKYIIKNKGFQVSPAELEAHLLGMDVVLDAGVIGKPDARAGEVPVAFIVLSASGAAEDPRVVKETIKNSVKQAKSSYKWLHDVYIVEKIPRLASGKIIAPLLKQMLNDTLILAQPPPAKSRRTAWWPVLRRLWARNKLAPV
ncbi:unnamed protein product [Mycena citricolor]|uniref:4-coumarate-CoA ligase n=1 Tax=Mycena citricolor TaxID=2018698 RepID=A0AAD2Q353_9AGAR|nr:unnamed protein product [Mycena citricolor]